MGLVVRIIAPIGRDAELTADLLRQNGIDAEPCSGVARGLSESASHMLGALLIAEEAIDQRTRAALIDALRLQPPWSDLPILILTSAGRAQPRSSVGRFSELGSPVLLERPLSPDTLVSSVRAALRARQRQFQIRETLEERDTALAALKNEQETLRVVIDNLPVAVIVTGRDGKMIIANQRAGQLFGKTLNPAGQGSPWTMWETVHPNGTRLKAEEYPLWRAIENGESVAPEDYLYRSGNGDMRWVRMAAAPIMDPHGAVSGGVAAISDIDREKRAEAALIKSEKLAAVGRLAASISHEINNPLEAVTNLLYLVERSSDGTPASLFAIRAQEELARVSQIVTQTLRFHRQSSSPQFISIRNLIEPALALFKRRAANLNISVDLRFHCEGRILCRDGDVRQVLNNLIGNAIDAMPGGGRLLIRTSAARDFRTDASGIRVSIADTGHGIKQETMKHIFEPFYTTKGDYGTGLGLWISQEIIARSNGRLRIRSRVGEARSGTVATVFLPGAVKA